MSRTIPSRIPLLIMIGALCALSLFSGAAAAYASQGDSSTPALQAVSLQQIETSDSTAYVNEDKQVLTQGLETAQVYDISGLVANPYNENSRIVITKVAGTGSATCKAVKSSDNCYKITTTHPGKVRVTCKETWTERTESFNEKTQRWVEKKQKKSLTHTFLIRIVNVRNVTGTVERCTTSSYSHYAYFTYAVSGISDTTNVEYVSDSCKTGNSSVSSSWKNRVRLYVYGLGTHVIKLKAYNQTFTCVAVLRHMSMGASADLKNTGSLVMYPGKKSTLSVKLTGTSNPKVRWKTGNADIATVSQRGVVAAQNKGKCYIYATVGSTTIKTLVEVTSREAYSAVRNAFADLRAGITYSQAERMSDGKRDCSSFVSRCYWDDSLNRHIFIIGDGWASSWAYTAAGQAQWLNDHDKRIAYSACSSKWLLPGDTVYFETDYAGKDASQWRYIDHASIYVGNGLLLNTHGSGGNGDIGFGYYRAKDPSVKFIGRPCP